MSKKIRQRQDQSVANEVYLSVALSVRAAGLTADQMTILVDNLRASAPRRFSPGVFAEVVAGGLPVANAYLERERQYLQGFEQANDRKTR